MPRREGYLLLTVVVMIAVASLMLARLANTSLRVASVAVEEERDLRSRWAVTSLRRFALDAAPSLLAGPPRDHSHGERAEPVFWRDVQLAGLRWRVIVSDESAKLSLPHLAARYDTEIVKRRMDDLLGGRVRPKPDFSGREQYDLTRWEHWIENGAFGHSVSAREVAVATQRLTLWGDGRLNVCRSEEQTVDILWRQLFARAAPRRLHKVRLQTPPPTTDELIAKLGLRESQAAMARKWITTESDCRSVWLFCHSDRRVSSTFFVEWGVSDASREHRGYEY